MFVILCVNCVYVFKNGSKVLKKICVKKSVKCQYYCHMISCNCLYTLCPKKASPTCLTVTWKPICRFWQFLVWIFLIKLAIKWPFSLSPRPVFVSAVPGGNTTSEIPFFTRKSRMLRAFLPSSGRLSVCLSHSWIVSKRCKLGSRNLHCGLPQGL